MNVSDLIAQSKQETQEAKTQLLKTFAFVPDDKLQWTPSSPARTPLQIVAHCGATNRVLAALLRGEEVPFSSDPTAAAAQVREGGKEIATRDAAIKLVEDATAEVMQALDQVTVEQLDTSPKGPFGAMPFSMWMRASAMHMGGHFYQLDYLQTIWGDLEAH